jgi:hypothetical protein
MSPAAIVAGVRALTQTKLLSAVPKKWVPQFSFGLQAYGLHTFQSATGNARMVVANVHTAATKTDRLLANAGLADQFGSVFDSLGLVKPGSFVNVDHSDMHGLLALVAALQTRKGRAVPCMVEATYASTIPAASDQPKWRKLRAAMVASRRVQSFTGHTIDSLQGLADRLGFWPKLVFDRGFGNGSIVEHLCAEGATFYIRVKAGDYVTSSAAPLVSSKIATLTEKDATIALYGLTLRVVRSPKSRRARELWYILTNDMTSSRSKVVKIYYHRFEIEETFKDVKHIFELKRTRLQKPNSLKVLLWLVCIGIALLYLVTKPTKRSCGFEAEHRGKIHPKKQTSWLRQAYEQLQQAYGLLLWGGVWK